jgi:hypothetical protein
MTKRGRNQRNGRKRRNVRKLKWDWKKRVILKRCKKGIKAKKTCGKEKLVFFRGGGLSFSEGPGGGEYDF